MTDLAADLSELEQQAAARLDPAAWDYLARGFADNVTARCERRGLGPAPPPTPRVA